MGGSRERTRSRHKDEIQDFGSVQSLRDRRLTPTEQRRPRSFCVPVVPVDGSEVPQFRMVRALPEILSLFPN